MFIRMTNLSYSSKDAANSSILPPPWIDYKLNNTPHKSAQTMYLIMQSGTKAGDINKKKPRKESEAKKSPARSPLSVSSVPWDASLTYIGTRSQDVLFPERGRGAIKRACASGSGLLDLLAKS